MTGSTYFIIPSCSYQHWEELTLSRVFVLVYTEQVYSCFGAATAVITLTWSTPTSNVLHKSQSKMVYLLLVEINVLSFIIAN